MKSLKLIFSIFIISFLLTLSNTNAEVEENNIIIVLDASGSMWGKVDNEYKISVAKQAVQDLVKDWESSSKIGLIAYGHRRKGDCSDIETLIPVGNPNVNSFKEVLSSLSAKGKTPLSQSVTLAAEELKFRENKATVILVSDGIETCDKDPCKVAAALEKAGVDFTAHVIGFDLTQKDQEKIKCIADNTGGKFLAANNAESLKNSMTEMIQTVEVSNAGVRFIAVDKPGGEPLDIDQWFIYELDDEGEAKEKFSYQSYSDKPKFSLLPGKYLVKVNHAKVTHKEVIEIKKDADEKHEILIPVQGIIRLVAIDKPNGEAIDIHEWHIFELDQDEEPKEKFIYHTYNDQPKFTLLPGKYQVKVKHAKVIHKEIVEVIGGEDIKHEIIIPTQGTIRLSAVDKPDGEAIDVNEWHIFELDQDGEPKEKFIYHSYNDQPKFTLLPGKYQVQVRHAKVIHREIIEVTSGEDKKIKIIIPIQGTIRLSAIDKPDGEAIDVNEWHIFELDQGGEPKEKSIYHSYKDQPKFTLLPGKYQAKVRYAKVIHKENIEVVSGTNKKIKIIIPAQGTVRLVALDKQDGEALDINEWQVFELDEDGEPKNKYIYQSYKDEPKFVLLPGKYQVKVRHAKVIHKETIEVIAGSNKKIKVIIQAQGKVKLTAVNTPGGEALDINEWMIYELDENSEPKEKYISQTYKDVAKFTLLPGKYLAKVRKDKSVTGEIFEVTAGKLKKVEVVFD